MKLLNFEAFNLFSLGQVEIDLNKRGLVLVTGHSHDEGSANGSGKSSLANKGIIWTLFGQTAGGTKGDEVINRHFDNKCRCTGVVTFRNVKGETCGVSRCRGPAGLEFHKLGENDRWVDLSLKTQAETQLLINQELGRDFKSFIQTDFFGQGREKSFMALTPAHQVELMEQILPIEELSEWVTYAKKAQKGLKGEVSKVEGEVQFTKGTQHQLQRFIDDLNRKAVEFDVDKAEGISQCQKDLDAYGDSVASKKQRLEELKTEQEQAPTEPILLVNIEGKDHENLSDQIRDASNHLNTHKATDQRLKLEYESLKSRVMSVDERCPTCKQSLLKEMQDSLMVKQHEIRGRLAQLDKDIEYVGVTLQGWEHHIVDLESKRDCTMKNYNAAVAAVNQMNSLIAHISVLEAEINSNKHVELLRKLKEREDAENPHGRELQFKIIELQNANAFLEVYEDKLSKLNEEHEHLSFWVDAFGKNFKNFLFRRACPFLQGRAAHHLSELGNDQLKVEFSTSKTLKSGDEKSGFSVHAYSEKGGKGFDNLSGGEQQMVSFAVGLALADLAETQAQGPSHFLILDEPFMALDERNCENLVNYLVNGLSNRRETILLISNEENLKSLVPERIHVEKTGGITSVKA